MAVVEPEHKENWWCRVRQNSEYWKRRFTWPNCVKMHYSNILSQQEVATKIDQMEKTDGDKSHLYVENILVLESSHKPKPLGSYSSRHNHWTELWGSFVKFLDEYGVEVPIPSICKTWRRDLRCDIQRNRALWEWKSHSWSKKNIQKGIARKSSRIQREHVLQTNRGNHQPQGNLGSS